MGAKLSKKKKGYCLGAGKDGESTDTTEVEQKTENQEGQKDDAAEPKGEKTPTDQSQSNGIAEEIKNSKSAVEVTSGEATKESKQDIKPEIKISTEEKDQPQGNKDEGKLAASDQACEKEKVKSSSEDKTKTECEVKETPAIAADKTTRESKPVKEKEGSECEQSPCENKQSAEVEVKKASEPVTKVAIEQKAPVSVEAEGHVSEKAAEVPTQVNKPVAEPEKVPEKMEQSAPKNVEPQSEPVDVESKPVIQIVVVEPEVVESSIQLAEKAKAEAAPVPEKVDSALPNLDHKSEPSLPEPEPSQVSEPLKSPLSEAVPEIKIEADEQDVKPEKEAQLVPCPATSDQTSEQKEQEVNPEPMPPKSTEVPNETTDAQGPTENQESLGCHNEGTNAVTIQVAASIEQPPQISEQHIVPLIQNGPSENLEEDHHAEAHAEAHAISTDLEAKDKEQKALEENGDLDKTSTQKESQVVKEDCGTPIDVVVTSNNENETKETNNSSQHCNSEDKTENQDTSTEKVETEKESPAPEIVEKHGVGNGLPIKEEIKVHLENDCDKDLHGLNVQSESHEIQVCNE